MIADQKASLIRVVVIDDEEPARLELIQLLAAFPEVQVVGDAEDVDSALVLTEAVKPDLVMLDIKLAGESGFDYVARLRPPAPHVVFVTAYDSHAVKAFECDALDYLLKPIRPERLSEVIRRFHERRHRSLAPKNGKFILLKTPTAPRLVAWDTVQYFQSSGNYTQVYLNDGAVCTMLRPLKEWIALMPADSFLQVHRRIAVRREAIREIRSSGDRKFELLMELGEVLPVGRTFLPEIRHALLVG
jgi:two-component system LytT family response regulator